ncbi:MAG: sterol desaturase family protein [Bacteroidota bacterium]
MDINPVILSIPVYFLLIGIELIIQFFSHKHIYRLNDAITNISCGITEQVSGAFVKIVSIGIYQYIFEHWSLFNIPVTWWSVLLLYLGVDLCYYWAHRLSHEVNIMWGGHVVHHQSEDYNFSVALRQGSFQKFWTLWFYLPLAFFGFDTVTFLLINALNTVYQFWIHTETIGKLPKPIEWIFNTPSHHRVHHGRNPKYIDKNHAGSLIIWDKMFGTFQEEEERPIYGITKPVNSWNPVWVNFQHYADLGKQFIATNGFANKLNVLFNKPGWRSPEDGGPLKVPEITNHEIKYNTQVSKPLGLYLLIQFILVLLGTSLFLFNQSNFDISQKLLFAALIIISIVLLGVLLENKTQWLFVEIFRLVGLIALGYFLNTPILFIQVLYVVCGISVISLITINKSYFLSFYKKLT